MVHMHRESGPARPFIAPRREGQPVRMILPEMAT